MNGVVFALIVVSAYVGLILFVGSFCGMNDDTDTFHRRTR